MMHIRHLLVSSVCAASLSLAPLSSASAHEFHHGGGPLFGLAAAVVGTAIAVATLPFAVANSVARPVIYSQPVYYPAPRIEYAPAPVYYPVRPTYYAPTANLYPVPPPNSAPPGYATGIPGPGTAGAGVPPPGY